MKILFIGIITDEIISQAKVEGLVGSFIDTAEAAAETGKICNAYNSIDIDFTVLVTHIGIEEDIKLAEILNPEWGVDLILGGHSHTFMDEPVVVNDIVIAHAGEGANNIGRFDIIVDTDDNCIDSYTWNFVPINNKTSEKDLQLEEVINKYKDITYRKYQRIITRFTRALTHPERNTETMLGSLISDIFQESLALDIMLLGSGSIRGTVLGPIVELGNLIQIFPYNDEIYMVKATGEQLKRMIKHMLRDEAFLGTTEYYQFSEGLRAVYSKSKRELLELKYDGEDVEDDQIFTMGLQSFHYFNALDFLNVSEEELARNQKPRMLATSTQDILVEYLSCHHRLDYHPEERIIIVD